MIKKAAIIGAGVGGLGAAIRLAVEGFDVTVFEANDNVGGKINNLQLGDYRFDMGPSVFTEPKYIKELFDLCKEDFSKFEYKKLPYSFHYFFQDGTTFKLPALKKDLIKTFEKELGEDPVKVNNYLNKAEKNYKSIAPLFIERSLHRKKQLLNGKLLKALSRIPKYKLNSTMAEENENTFSNPKTHQLFNRYATYNGSSPYLAPAMLNMIQHLELTEGVFLPKNGMVQIAYSLRDLAIKKGVKFRFNEKVNRISLNPENNKVEGIETHIDYYDFQVVVSNMDVGLTYENLIPQVQKPHKTLNQERSSSAMVFYWGISRTFENLGVHNMLFSKNYQEEFNALFKTKGFFNDPSIYIHITSKENKEDAPMGKENWFVMINTPNNVGQDWKEYQKLAKKQIIHTINETLKTDIEPLIEEEFIMDPLFIERKYSGKAGSIYGNASNNKYAAFYRHPNFSKTVKGLYFVGVTVHPGGGIPLALNSAKIAVRCIKEDGFIS
jgi:phytoene desaturase